MITFYLFFVLLVGFVNMDIGQIGFNCVKKTKKWKNMVPMQTATTIRQMMDRPQHT